jgi:cell division protein FtsB
MQTRTIVGAGALLAAGALAVTQLSMQSQDRQYKKTLAYMHDGREKIQERMNSMTNSVSEAVTGKK